MEIGISVVVPCYNNWKYIEELLDSFYALNLRYKSEVIIVDDASSEYINIKKYKYRNLKIINHKINLGVQEARNTGLYSASYKYIMMLDADDKFPVYNENEENFINLSIDMLEKNENIVFVHGLVEMFGAFDGYTISAYPVDAKMISRKHHVQTSIIYRCEEAKSAGGYFNQIQKWQDWSFGVALLNNRICKNKKIDIGFLNITAYMYRIHEFSERISLKKVSEYEMTMKTIKRYREFFLKFYGNMVDEELAKKILDSKPTRLIDLLYVANYDFERAIDIISHRKYDVSSSNVLPNIP